MCLHWRCALATCMYCSKFIFIIICSNTVLYNTVKNNYTLKIDYVKML